MQYFLKLSSRVNIPCQESPIGQVISYSDLPRISVDGLIMIADKILSSLPPDANKFSGLFNEIRQRPDTQAIVVCGPGLLSDKLIKGLGYHRIESLMEIPAVFTYFSLRSNRENKFLLHILDNIFRYVKTGIALVVRQEKMFADEKYTSIAVLDNGRGLVDQCTRKMIAIQEAIKCGGSLGAWRGHGCGFTLSTGLHSDISLICAADMGVIIRPIQNILLSLIHI